jgi:hypothetical protein
MKAEQYIRLSGLDKAKRVIASSANALVQCFDGTTFHVSDLKRLVESVDLVNDLGGMEKLTPYFITTDKRLGYTHVNVAGNGRLCFLDDFCDFIPEQAISIKRVMEAIADCESIYGEGNE